MKPAPQSSEELIRQKLFKVNKESFAYQLAKLIYPAAVSVIGKRSLKLKEIDWEHPASPDHGDYSSNIAMVKFPDLSSGKQKEIKTPFDLANKIVNVWRTQGLPDFIAKIEVALPGFINVWVKNEVLISQLHQVIEERDRFGKLGVMEGKKILLEHTSPNPQTTIMLGHLRNNFLGMSMAKIMEFMGAKVVKDCIVNDRGMHLCRAIWGYLAFGRKRTGLTKEELLEFKKVSDAKLKKAMSGLEWEEMLRDWVEKKSNWWKPKELDLKPDHANLIWYVLGSRVFKLSEKVESQVKEILIAWEKEDKSVWQAWRQILDWSKKGYADTYQRIGSVHDQVWYEHKLYQKGKEWVEKGLKKGVFKESEGAVVSYLAKYGLPDTIVQKSDGTALYHTFDLNLTLKKRTKFPSDLYIWDIGVEQTLYLKQLFAMCEQLGIGKREDYFHLSYALINFKGGKKMASRTGKVITADEILDDLHERAVKIISESNQELRGNLTDKQLDDLAETVALGAVKYSLLKFSRDTTIYFDPDESLALEGNSGPYLQYTFARCQSVLGKEGGVKEKKVKEEGLALEDEERSILRTLYQFPEVVQEAAERLAPNLICNYLYDLAQKYNFFYNKLPILKAGRKDLVDLRLALTAATTQVLKNGLNLLGIEAPERM